MTVAAEVEITVNGEARRVEPGTRLDAYLSGLGYEPAAVAVEYNREILKRARFGETELEEGDNLEIVRFVQGG